MSHFAEVIDGIVTRVIVAEQDFINTLPNPKEWVQTSYNTRHGIHRKGKTPLRKNYAGVGFIYDKGRDAFIAPQPYPSWLLDDETFQWNAPTPTPNDGKMYDWDEPTTNWVERATTP